MINNNFQETDRINTIGLLNLNDTQSMVQLGGMAPGMISSAAEQINRSPWQGWSDDLINQKKVDIFNALNQLEAIRPINSNNLVGRFASNAFELGARGTSWAGSRADQLIRPQLQKITKNIPQAVQKSWFHFGNLARTGEALEGPLVASIFAASAYNTYKDNKALYSNRRFIAPIGGEMGYDMSEIERFKENRLSRWNTGAFGGIPSLLGSKLQNQGDGLLGRGLNQIGNALTALPSLKMSSEQLTEINTKAMTSYNQFASALTNVNTILKKSDGQLKEYGQSLQKLVKDDLKNSVTSVQALNAAYEAASAGYVKTRENQQVMVAGLKLAKAGAADTGEVMRMLTQVMNTYGASSAQAGGYAAKFNTIVEKGITTIPELSATIGQVSVVAKAAGVNLDEVGASIATMTTKGMGTAEAGTALSSLLMSTITKTPQAEKAIRELNKNITNEEDKIRLDSKTIQNDPDGRGLIKQLENISKATRGDASLAADIFSSQTAYRGYTTLMNDKGSTLSANFEALKNTTAAGLEKVFGIRLDTQDERLNKIFNRMEESYTKIGEKIEPFFDKSLTSMEGFVAKLADSTDSFSGMLLTINNLKAGLENFGGAIKNIIGLLATGAGLYAVSRFGGLIQSGISSFQYAKTSSDDWGTKVGKIVPEMLGINQLQRKELTAAGGTITSSAALYNEARRRELGKSLTMNLPTAIGQPLYNALGGGVAQNYKTDAKGQMVLETGTVEAFQQRDQRKERLNKPLTAVEKEANRLMSQGIVPKIKDGQIQARDLSSGGIADQNQQLREQTRKIADLKAKQANSQNMVEAIELDDQRKREVQRLRDLKSEFGVTGRQTIGINQEVREQAKKLADLKAKQAASTTIGRTLALEGLITTETEKLNNLKTEARKTSLKGTTFGDSIEAENRQLREQTKKIRDISNKQANAKDMVESIDLEDQRKKEIETLRKLKQDLKISERRTQGWNFLTEDISQEAKNYQQERRQEASTLLNQTQGQNYSQPYYSGVGKKEVSVNDVGGVTTRMASVREMQTTLTENYRQRTEAIEGQLYGANKTEFQRAKMANTGFRDFGAFFQGIEDKPDPYAQAALSEEDSKAAKKRVTEAAAKRNMSLDRALAFEESSRRKQAEQRYFAENQTKLDQYARDLRTANPNLTSEQAMREARRDFRTVARGQGLEYAYDAKTGKMQAQSKLRRERQSAIYQTGQKAGGVLKPTLRGVGEMAAISALFYVGGKVGENLWDPIGGEGAQRRADYAEIERLGESQYTDQEEKQLEILENYSKDIKNLQKTYQKEGINLNYKTLAKQNLDQKIKQVKEDLKKAPNQFAKTNLQGELKDLQQQQAKFEGSKTEKDLRDIYKLRDVTTAQTSLDEQKLAQKQIEDDIVNLKEKQAKLTGDEQLAAAASLDAATKKKQIIDETVKSSEQLIKVLKGEELDIDSALKVRSKSFKPENPYQAFANTGFGRATTNLGSAGLGGYLGFAAATALAPWTGGASYLALPALGAIGGLKANNAMSGGQLTEKDVATFLAATGQNYTKDAKGKINYLKPRAGAGAFLNDSANWLAQLGGDRTGKIADIYNKGLAPTIESIQELDPLVKAYENQSINETATFETNKKYTEIQEKIKKLDKKGFRSPIGEKQDNIERKKLQEELKNTQQVLPVAGSEKSLKTIAPSLKETLMKPISEFTPEEVQTFSKASEELITSKEAQLGSLQTLVSQLDSQMEITNKKIEEELTKGGGKSTKTLTQLTSYRDSVLNEKERVTERYGREVTNINALKERAETIKTEVELQQRRKRNAGNMVGLFQENLTASIEDYEKNAVDTNNVTKDYEIAEKTWKEAEAKALKDKAYANSSEYKKAKTDFEAAKTKTYNFSPERVADQFNAIQQDLEGMFGSNMLSADQYISRIERLEKGQGSKLFTAEQDQYLLSKKEELYGLRANEKVQALGVRKELEQAKYSVGLISDESLLATTEQADKEALDAQIEAKQKVLDLQKSQKNVSADILKQSEQELETLKLQKEELAAATKYSKEKLALQKQYVDLEISRTSQDIKGILGYQDSSDIGELKGAFKKEASLDNQSLNVKRKEYADLKDKKSLKAKNLLLEIKTLEKEGVAKQVGQIDTISGITARANSLNVESYNLETEKKELGLSNITSEEQSLLLEQQRINEQASIDERYSALEKLYKSKGLAVPKTLKQEKEIQKQSTDVTSFRSQRQMLEQNYNQTLDKDKGTQAEAEFYNYYKSLGYTDLEGVSTTDYVNSLNSEVLYNKEQAQIKYFENLQKQYGGKLPEDLENQKTVMGRQLDIEKLNKANMFAEEKRADVSKQNSLKEQQLNFLMQDLEKLGGGLNNEADKLINELIKGKREEVEIYITTLETGLNELGQEISKETQQQNALARKKAEQEVKDLEDFRTTQAAAPAINKLENQIRRKQFQEENQQITASIQRQVLENKQREQEAYQETTAVLNKFGIDSPYLDKINKVQAFETGKQNLEFEKENIRLAKESLGDRSLEKLENDKQKLEFQKELKLNSTTEPRKDEIKQQLKDLETRGALLDKQLESEKSALRVAEATIKTRQQALEIEEKVTKEYLTQFDKLAELDKKAKDFENKSKIQQVGMDSLNTVIGVSQDVYGNTAKGRKQALELYEIKMKSSDREFENQKAILKIETERFALATKQANLVLESTRVNLQEAARKAREEGNIKEANRLDEVVGGIDKTIEDSNDQVAQSRLLQEEQLRNLEVNQDANRIGILQTMQGLQYKPERAKLIRNMTDQLVGSEKAAQEGLSRNVGQVPQNTGFDIKASENTVRIGENESKMLLSEMVTQLKQVNKSLQTETSTNPTTKSTQAPIINIEVKSSGSEKAKDTAKSIKDELNNLFNNVNNYLGVQG